jgi:hypothetical protein
MTKKYIFSAFAAALVFSASLSGCAQKVSAQEITNRTLEAFPGVNTVRMSMQSTFDTASAGSSSSFTMSTTQSMTAEIQTSPPAMHAIMNISLNTSPLGNLNVSTTLYLIESWMYASTNLTGSVNAWTKYQLKPEDWTSQNQLEQQAEFLKSAVQVSLVGSEKVEGVECFVLDVKPDLVALSEFMNAQESGSGVDGIDFSRFDLVKIFKTYSIKEWVAKDNYLLQKAEMKVVMDLSQQEVMPTSSAEKATFTIKSTIYFHDYNKPVNITLPPEALAAKEYATIH